MNVVWTLASVVPVPGGDPADDVGPGVWGFVVTLAFALVVIAIIVDMARRMRRVRYREEVRAELDREEQSGRQAPPPAE